MVSPLNSQSNQVLAPLKRMYRPGSIRVWEEGHLTPWRRVPALMRSIQRDRMSRFLLRRSRYEYCSAFSTRSLAIRMQFLARPRNPFANLKILSLFILSPPPRPDQNPSAGSGCRSRSEPHERRLEGFIRRGHRRRVLPPKGRRFMGRTFGPAGPVMIPRDISEWIMGRIHLSRCSGLHIQPSNRQWVYKEDQRKFTLRNICQTEVHISVQKNEKLL